MFVDQIRIFAKAGDGGSGCASFRREKFVPKGGPDGGDGGDGGSVILRADVQLSNLVNLYYEPIIRAKNGERGMGKQKYGRSADDKIIPVPLGTLIYRLPAPAPHDPADFSGENEQPRGRRKLDSKDLELLADLNEDGAEFLLCEGGRGGRGNMHFKSSRNRTPRQFTTGTPGAEGWFFLEMRMIADVGLVGYPNAGKSTLLGALSAAHPKVAAYPFTTLRPMVGVADFPGFRRATIADIPGLIEGAHRDAGLGHDFLRHIVRCRTLLLVVDAAGSEGRDPVEDIKKIREELRLYDPSLVRRPWALVANKTDLPEARENLPRLAGEFPDVPLIEISAQRGDGLEALRAFLDAEVGRPG